MPASLPFTQRDKEVLDRLAGRLAKGPQAPDRAALLGEITTLQGEVRALSRALAAVLARLDAVEAALPP